MFSWRGQVAFVGVVVLTMLGTITGPAAGGRATPEEPGGTHAEYDTAEYLGVVDMSALAQSELQLGERLETPWTQVPNTAVSGAASLATDPTHSQPLVAGPNPVADFQGNTYSGWIPPDTQGAVGPDHLMAVTNGSVRIQERDGTVLSTVTLNDFFAGFGVTESTFDPRILFDHHAEQWLLIATANARAIDSAIVVGVSVTDDPTGTWFGYSIDADDRTEIGVATWADYPNVGYNDNWVAISANMFTTGGTSSFERTKIWIFDRADLYNGGSLAFGFFGALDPLVHNRTIVPAVTYDTGVTTLYLFSTWNSNFDGKGWMKLYEITGPVDGAVISDGQFISTSTPWNAGGTNFAPQTGTTERIHVGDHRILNMVYRGGLLYAAHTVFLPAGTPTRSSVQVWSGLDPDALTTAVCQIDDPTATIFRGFPSVDVNAAGDMLVGYSTFSSTSHPSAAYSFHDRTDLSCQFRDEVVYKSGESTYVSLDGIGRNRWGDYSATVVDPTNDLDLWTIQEYSAATANTWGTWWARLGIAAPANDNFADAEAITLPVALSGSNVGAGVEASEPLSCLDPDIGAPSPFGATVWYGLNVATDGEVTLDTFGSDFDTVVGVYTGSDLALLTEIACDDDDPVEFPDSSLNFMATAGTTYWIQVGGYGATTPATGNLVLNAVQSAADAVPPVWPGGSELTATTVADTSVGLSWDPATDNVGVVMYKVYVDGTFWGSTSGTSMDVVGLTPGTDYTFKVEAMDAAGNETVDGPSVTVRTTGGDGSLPPWWPDGSAVFAVDVFEDYASVTWTPAEDDLAVEAYAVYLDHQLVGTSQSTSFQVTNLQPGTTYHVSVEAGDGNGNWTNGEGPGIFITTAADFLDTNGHLFELDIEWLAGAAITLGCNPPDNDMFCPDQRVTRGQMAAFLSRALDLEDRLDDPFWDDDGVIFEADIERLAAAGITRGCNPPLNDQFCPNHYVTRGQMAAFLVRAFALPNPSINDLFVDDDDSIFEADIDKLADSGVTRGCNPPTNDRFCPDQHVTRGQMAAFLHRAFGL